MFLTELSSEQKRSFYKIASHAVLIDGNLHEKEAAMLRMVLLEMQITAPVNPEALNVAEECKVFNTEVSRRICFLELCCLVTADEEVHEHEEQFMKELAGYLLLGAEYSDRCMAFADTLVMLIKTGQRLIFT